MGRANAAADPDHGSETACFGLAAAGLPSPHLGTRYTGVRPVGKPLQEMTVTLVLILLFLGPLTALADTIYVSNEQDNPVSVIVSTSLEVTATLDVGRRPRGIVLNQDRN